MCVAFSEVGQTSRFVVELAHTQVQKGHQELVLCFSDRVVRLS